MRKLCCAVVLSFCALSLHAAAPYLVKDINQLLTSASSSPRGFLPLGSYAFFIANDANYNPQLWRTDGTDAGTIYLAPGGYSSVVWNGKVWFLTATASELWSTDGTVAGTQKMTMPAGMPSPATATWLMAGPTRLYFFNGATLWQTDGTTAGTVQVSTVAFTLSTVGSWGSTSQAVFFLASGNGSAFNSLWCINANGVTLLKDTPSSNENFAGSVIPVGNLIFVETVSGLNASHHLWRSDGTVAGTFSIKSTQPLTLTNNWIQPLPAGSLLYFTADDGSGSKLWKSDGTDAGTVAVASSLPGASSTFTASILGRLPNGAILLNGPAISPSAPSWGLWVFNGTTTTFLANIAGSQEGFVVLGTKAIFGSGTSLWQSDGTAAGTFALAAPSWPITSMSGWMSVVGSTVYFDAADATHGDELWKTDGTSTTFVKDVLAATYPSNPDLFRSFKGGLLFTASSDSTNGSNGTRDLWFSDGTAAGTQKLVASVGASSIVPCGTQAFFDRTVSTSSQLWSTNGTAAGTYLVTSLAASQFLTSLTCVDGYVLFIVYTNSQTLPPNLQLWRSNGTAAGTLVVAPLTSDRYPTIPPLTRLGHNVLFAQSDNTYERLWRSDGTPAGTIVPNDLEASAGVAFLWPSSLVASGSNVYFTTQPSTLNNTSLWRSDGTAAGTVSFLTDASIGVLADFYGRIVIDWSSSSVQHGLCTSDGTNASITCFDPNLNLTGPLETLNGLLYYNNQSSIRSTNGTSYLDTGIPNPGPLFKPAGGRLYFGYSTSVTTTLFETDGTAAGTTSLMSGVSQIAPSGGRLFISAGELYAYDMPVTATSFAPQSVDTAGGATVTITGRGFIAPATVTVGGIAATVGSTTATSIAFTAPAHDPGTCDVELTLGDGRRMFLDAPLAYSCTTPTAVITAPAPACPLVPVQLQGSGGVRCAWFPGTGLDDPSSCTPKATISAATTYTLLVFSANGCPSTNNPSVTLSVLPQPSAAFTTSGSYPWLQNSTYTASAPDAGAGATYVWSGSGITIDNPTQNPITFHTTCAQGQLSLTVTAADGCSNASTLTLVTVTPTTQTSFSPNIAAPGTNVIVTGTGFRCETMVGLLPSGGGNFVWVNATAISVTTLQFRYPVNAPRKSFIQLWDSRSKYLLYRTVPHDFKGNHLSDVYWRNSATGETSFWYFYANPFAVNSWTIPLPWTPVAIGDFDGNGIADIFWRNPATGETSIWLMTGGATPTTYVRSLTVDPAWSVVGTGDFDGDGKTDIFWRNTQTGETSIWFMNGTNFTGVRSWTIPLSWAPVAFGDFDGDGKTDMFWYNATTGETSIWLMNGTFPSVAVRSVTVDPSWMPVGTGDFNSDTKDDIFWFNKKTGETGIWYMNGTAIASWASQMTVTSGWRPINVGFFDLYSTPSTFWYNDTTGQTGVWSFSFSPPNWQPLTTVSDLNWKPVVLP